MLHLGLGHSAQEGQVKDALKQVKHTWGQSSHTHSVFGMES